MSRVTLAVLVFCLAASCAKAPQSIAPAYVSAVNYSGWTCKQLSEEALRLESALAVASEQQENARTNDVVGVLLIGLPVSSLSGDNIAPQIARYKGEKEAIRYQQIKRNCNA